MLLPSLLAVLAASGAFAADCLCVPTVTVSRYTTIYVPDTTLLTLDSTVSTATVPFTVTSAITSTITSTAYTGTTSTSYVFLPGSPHAKRELQGRAGCNADNCLRALRATKVLASAEEFCSSYTATSNTVGPFPTFVPSECNASRVSSACSCLPTPTCSTPTTTVRLTIELPRVTTVTDVVSITVTTTATIVVQRTVLTTTAVTEQYPVSTKTVYPCASPTNFLGPTYGDASGTSNLGLSNNIYGLSTAEGADAQSCCNTCFFELSNCVQAYWYSYEGCVVSQATDLSSGTGRGITSECPAGVFGGLSYGPDLNPAFRSTGNIAGPCGENYSNF